MRAQPRTVPDSARTLGKAVVRAAELLGLTQGEVAGIVGSSPASISRTFAGERGVDPVSAEGRHALLLVRVFRSLDALVGGDATRARLWLRARNTHLGGAPLRLLAGTQGLVHVAEYLDALRGTL
jgi:transcriptional regulator with XRE-family HTH domain